MHPRCLQLFILIFSILYSAHAGQHIHKTIAPLQVQSLADIVRVRHALKDILRTYMLEIVKSIELFKLDIDELHKRVDFTPPETDIDRDLAHQVLTQLLSNMAAIEKGSKAYKTGKHLLWKNHFETVDASIRSLKGHLHDYDRLLAYVLEQIHAYARTETDDMHRFFLDVNRALSDQVGQFIAQLQVEPSEDASSDDGLPGGEATSAQARNE